MSEIMECSDCGGSFLEDHGKCICNEKKIRKLKRELNVMTRLFYACALGDEIPAKLMKKYNSLMGDEEQ